MRVGQSRTSASHAGYYEGVLFVHQFVSYAHRWRSAGRTAVFLQFAIEARVVLRARVSQRL